jgi:16S rRNA (cytosine1402-N4)-methyltransferase
MEYKHKTVMKDESVSALNVKKGGVYIDCTLGGGGHSEEILKRGGNVIAFDLDPDAIENAKIKLKKYQKNLKLVNDNFKNIDNYLEGEIDGALMDLGLSSYELDDKKRGFSFKGNNPLNMSFSGSKDRDAKFIVNNYKEEDLVKIFQEYGEEERSKSVAKEIVKERKIKKIETTDDLVSIILKVKRFSKNKIHPATKVFQALRIEVNNEIKNLKETLPKIIDKLKPKGRLVVISFHSIEDRAVKEFAKKESRDCICPPEFPICVCHHKKNINIINKKPIIPKDEEVKDNIRSRSSKLRILEKI